MKNTIDHSHAAAIFNKDVERVNWHDETLWFVRSKRDRSAHAIPEWEALRETASNIKNNVLSNMHYYLQEFEAKAKENGIIIHWAADGDEHNKIVHSIIAKYGVT